MGINNSSNLVHSHQKSRDNDSVQNFKKNSPIYNESLKAKYNVSSNLKIDETGK